MYITKFVVSLCASLGALALGSSVNAQEAHPDPRASAMRYDGAGRLVGQILPDPDGMYSLSFPAVRTVYDTAGLVLRVENGVLATWQPTSVDPNNWTGFTILGTERYFYDTMGRVVRTEVAGSDGVTASVTQANYDREGRAGCAAVRMDPAKFGSAPANACAQSTGTVGPHGVDRISKNVYSAVDGRLLQIRKGVGSTVEIADVTYEYTENGKTRTVVDANGNRAELRYDGHDRQNRWVFPSKTAAGSVDELDYEAYTYDRNGNRKTLRKRDNTTITYHYDALGQLVTKDIPVRTGLDALDSRDVYYTYDLRGLQLSARFGSTTGPGIINSYDGFGQLISTTNSLLAGNPDLEYEYDRGGNRVGITHPDGQSFGMGYDLLGRLAVINKAGTTLFTATYNDKGGVQNVARNGNAHAQAYDYDALGRVSSIGVSSGTSSSNVTWTFARNPASQIRSEIRNNDLYAWTQRTNASRDYSVNGLNQYTTTQVGSVATGYCYDDNGNLTDDNTFVYLYDVENRLVEMRSRTLAAGACPGFANGYSGALKARLRYDPAGRLYEVTDGDTSAVTRFLHDGNALVLEYNGSNTVTQRYVHGSDMEADDPLLWYEGASTTLAQLRNLYSDPRGSIIFVARNDGTTLGINTYNEWGINSSTNQGRFQYTGQAWLAELGMYYYKARVYSPTLGRFMQVDPIGYEDQYNLYAYVMNDPINKRDFSGNDGEDLWDGVVKWAGNVASQMKGNFKRIPSDIKSFPGHFANGTTGLPPTASGGGEIVTSPVRLFQTARMSLAARGAPPSFSMAEALLPKGVTRHIFAEVGVWRTEGGVAAAVTRSREVSPAAIQGLKDVGVSKKAVSYWQKVYQGAINTVRTDGTKFTNETARYRSEVLQSVLRNW